MWKKKIFKFLFSAYRETVYLSTGGRGEALRVCVNKFSVWEERCQLILQNIALHHERLYCLLFVRWHSLRTAEIHNIVWLDQLRNISVKPGRWSAFKTGRLSQVPLGQVTCISTPLFSKQRSTCRLGNLSHDPNFFPYLPRPTHIKLPNKTWTSINNIFLLHNLLFIKGYMKRRNSIILR